MKKLLVVVFLIIIGCVSLPHYSTGDLRTLRIILIYNNNVNLDKALEMVREASNLTEKEVGINFHIIKTIPIGGNSEYGNITIKDHIIALRQLRSLAMIYGYKDKDYDMVLGFANDPILTKTLGWFMNKPFGVIEDTYRRYIVFQHPTVKVVRHEVYHAFILTEGHTTRLMGSLSVLNPSPTASWLNKRDRDEVLINKWRDFSMKPEISLEYRQDRLDYFNK
jgi:hypothetical protein